MAGMSEKYRDIERMLRDMLKTTRSSCGIPHPASLVLVEPVQVNFQYQTIGISFSLMVMDDCAPRAAPGFGQALLMKSMACCMPVRYRAMVSAPAMALAAPAMARRTDRTVSAVGTSVQASFTPCKSW